MRSVACTTKRTIVAIYGIDAFVLVDVQLVVVRHTPVILQSLGSRGFFIEARHRNVTDLQQLGSGEECHVGGVVVERIDDAAFVDNHCVQAPPPQFDSTGEASGPGANDDGVESGHSLLSTSAETSASA